MIHQKVSHLIFHIRVHFDVVQSVHRYGKDVMLATLYGVVAMVVGSQVDMRLHLLRFECSLVHGLNDNGSGTCGFEPAFAEVALVAKIHSGIYVVRIVRKLSVYTSSPAIFKDIECLGDCLIQLVLRFKGIVHIRCQPVVVLVGGSAGQVCIYIRSLRKQVAASGSILHVPADDTHLLTGSRRIVYHLQRHFGCNKMKLNRNAVCAVARSKGHVLLLSYHHQGVRGVHAEVQLAGCRHKLLHLQKRSGRL